MAGAVTNIHSQPISVPLSHRCLYLPEMSGNVCIALIAAARSVQGLCLSAQNIICSGQGDAAAAETVTVTNPSAQFHSLCV